MELIYKFFEDFTPEVILGGTAMIILFFWPGFGIKFMNWVKNSLKLTGNAANNFIVFILMVFAFLALLVTGYFRDMSVGDINLTTILAIGSMCYTLSQIMYRYFYPKPEAPPEVPDEKPKPDPLPDTGEGNH